MSNIFNPMDAGAAGATQRLTPEVLLINGRAMQRQPAQQQQGGGGGKGGGGSTAAVAAPAPPPPPPVIEDTEGKSQDAADSLRRRQGALATNLTGTNGSAAPTTSGKTLLGA